MGCPSLYHITFEIYEMQHIDKFRKMVGSERSAAYSGNTWLAGQFRKF